MRDAEERDRDRIRIRAAGRSRARRPALAMPIGVTAVTPAVPRQAATVASSSEDWENDGCPESGWASTRRSPGRPSTADTSCAASPPVRPARNPTSRVIRATTAPMSTNLPRANRRSRQATNTMDPSGAGALPHRRDQPRRRAPRIHRERFAPCFPLSIDPDGPRPPYAPGDMAHSTLSPVFVGLRTGLHVLVAALLALVVVRVLVADSPRMVAALALAAAFAVLYLLGARVRLVRESRRAAVGAVWITALTAAWIALLVLVPDAAYLVFRSSSSTCTRCRAPPGRSPWWSRRSSRWWRSGCTAASPSAV